MEMIQFIGWVAKWTTISMVVIMILSIFAADMFTLYEKNLKERQR